VHDSFGAGLEVVELVGAVVDAIELRKFLSRMPRLRSFKLSYETKWHGCGHDWDAGDVMSVIEDQVGEQLEDLSFSILNCYGDPGSEITSLKNFKKLKQIELDVEVLLGAYHRPSRPQRIDGKVASSEPREIPQLGDLLPPAVESFCLLVHKLQDSTKVMNKLFSKIAADKDDKLPNLREIIIRNDSEGIPEEFPRDSEDAVREELEELDSIAAGQTSEMSPADGLNADSGDPDRNVQLDEDENDKAEESSNAASENSTNQAAEESLEPRRWDADLEALDASIDISLVKVNERDDYGHGYGRVTPSFMRSFCTRYEVECM